MLDSVELISSNHLASSAKISIEIIPTMTWSLSSEFVRYEQQTRKTDSLYIDFNFFAVHLTFKAPSHMKAAYSITELTTVEIILL